MFLLPSIALGIGFALLLGGRPSRLVEIQLRRGWAVIGAFGLQALLFTPWTDGAPLALENGIHLASYSLLFVFAAANVRNLALLPLLGGMALNAVVIAVNGGQMPVSPTAWEAAGLEAGERANVRLGSGHLGFLGDVFAIPEGFPFANVFSAGDLLIAAGTIAFIVVVSLGGSAERVLVPRRLVRPLASPDFRRLATGRLVSHLGDWLTLAALVGWVYDTTASTGQVALLLLVRLAPPILGGGIAAALVDRLRKERILVAIEGARGLAVAAALAGVLLDAKVLIFAAVAVSGALAAVSAATVPALVPSLLDEEQLPAANAALGIAQDAAMALGALGAGIALSASGAAVALLADLGTFAVAATLYWGIRARPLVHEPDHERGSVLAGLRYLLGRRALLVVVGAFAAATLATGLTNATLPRFLDGELGLGAGAYGFGLSALAWGLVAGQAVVGLAHVGRGGTRWIGVALLFMGALFVGLAFSAHAPTAILLLALVGFVDGTTDVLFDTIVQREADPRFYGRIFGFASAFMTTTMMGAVAAAPLANRIAAPHDVIFFAGAFLFAASGVALAGTRRGVAASALPARVGSR
jgi:hypothetical protein